MNLFPILVNLDTIAIKFALSNHWFAMKLETGRWQFDEADSGDAKEKYREGISLAIVTTCSVTLGARKNKEIPSSMQMKRYRLS